MTTEAAGAQAGLSVELDLDVAGATAWTAALPAGEAAAALEFDEPAIVRVRRPARPSVRLALPGRWQQRYVVSLVALDFVLAGVASSLGLFMRFGTHHKSAAYLALTLAFPFAFVLFTAATRAYETRFLGAGSDEYRRLFDAVVRLAAMVAIVSFLFKLDIARGYVVAVLPMAGLLTLLGRYSARAVLRRLRARGACQDRVVVVGRERSIAELVRQVRRQPDAGFQVVGACLDRPQKDRIEDVPVLGGSSDVLAVLRREQADALAVTAWSDLSQADLRHLSWQLEGSDVQLLVAPRLTDIAGPRISVRPVAGLPLLHVEEPEFTGGRRLVKGVIERLLATATLLVLSPLLLFVALGIRLTSPGPALLRQKRIGAGGRVFTMLKFRTMCVDAEEQIEALRALNERADGPLFKVRDDPRVTRIGRWLRRLSIDELPQLINVTLGSMSLVGPRPPLPREVRAYASDVRRRLLVRPGMTGLWQISGRSDLSWEESVRLDLYYVENWSIAMDLSILFRTLFAVLSARGAY